MRVPLFEFDKSYANFRNKIDIEIKKTIDSSIFINGESVAKLEEEISNYLGVKHCIGMSSGTDSLLTIFLSLGLESGDKVMVTPFTFLASATAIKNAGLEPVFVDISKDKFYPDIEQISKAYTEDIKAILIVHLFGEPVELEEIHKFCDHKGMILVEDCAQSFGSKFKDGSQTGTIGTAGAFSFFPTKNLGCFGDGGAICTNDDLVAERITKIKNHGCRKKYHPEILGYNFRLDTIQASILRVMLNNLSDLLGSRRKVANKYISGLLSVEEIVLPTDSENRTWNQFCIRIKNRDNLKNFLDSKNVSSNIYYPVSLNKTELFDYNISMTNSETLCNEILALPIYPNMPMNQVEFVIQTIREFYNA